MQAPTFLEEVGAKLITSRQRFGPYIARAFATTYQSTVVNSMLRQILHTEYPFPCAFQGILRVHVLHAM
jgi:D-serine dehydratase